MDQGRKKRSPNYTFEEKENLISIIAKYQNVIECKKTGAFYIKQKDDAWKSITNEYNSLCTTGPRDRFMLKHFYNNIKHRARKDSADVNKQRYLTSLTEKTKIVEDFNPPTNTQTKQHFDIQVEYDDNVPIVNENLIKDLKRKHTDEQKNIKKTGGGSFTSTLTEADHQILSVLDDQIRPDENPYDDAAEYFGEKIEEIPILCDTKIIPNPVAESNPVPLIRRKLKQVPQRKNKINKLSALRNHSAEALKRIYFKKKIELTYYQKKNEMQRYRFEQKKHNLEMQILKKKLEKADRDLM